MDWNTFYNKVSAGCLDIAALEKKPPRRLTGFHIEAAQALVHTGALNGIQQSSRKPSPGILGRDVQEVDVAIRLQIDETLQPVISVQSNPALATIRQSGTKPIHVCASAYPRIDLGRRIVREADGSHGSLVYVRHRSGVGWRR